MITSDTTDVNSLVSYINDIKPFHTKLTEVVIEYQANDNMNVNIVDAEKMDIHMSSVWRLEEVSDGIQTRYRIPAAVFPHYSKDFHQSHFHGVTDEIPGLPGAYHVPANEAVQVLVNGFVMRLGIDYTTNADRTTVQFIGNSIPKLGDTVYLNWAVMDRVFIGIGSNPIVWDAYQLEYITPNSTYALMPFDTGPFDADVNGLYFNGEESAELYVSPYGYVRIEHDAKNQAYYVFDFIKPLPLNTEFWIQVEQREAYNGWTQTSITETLKFSDVFRFNEMVNVTTADPDTWIRNPELFGININSEKTGYYDINNFDAVGYDGLPSDLTLGYYRFLDIKKYNDGSEGVEGDSYNSSFVDLVSFSITQYAYYDTDNFDTDGYDGTTTVSSTYIPDSTGTVFVNRPSQEVDIYHNYGYNPIVGVYINGVYTLPYAVIYPYTSMVRVLFDVPVVCVIRLV